MATKVRVTIVAGIALVLGVAAGAFGRTLVENRVDEIRVLLARVPTSSNPSIRIDYETLTTDGTRIDERLLNIPFADRQALNACFKRIRTLVYDRLELPEPTPATPEPEETP